MRHLVVSLMVYIQAHTLNNLFFNYLEKGKLKIYILNTKENIFYHKIEILLIENICRIVPVIYLIVMHGRHFNAFNAHILGIHLLTACLRVHTKNPYRKP